MKPWIARESSLQCGHRALSRKVLVKCHNSFQCLLKPKANGPLGPLTYLILVNVRQAALAVSPREHDRKWRFYPLLRLRCQLRGAARYSGLYTRGLWREWPGMLRQRVFDTWGCTARRLERGHFPQPIWVWSYLNIREHFQRNIAFKACFFPCL